MLLSVIEKKLNIFCGANCRRYCKNNKNKLKYTAFYQAITPVCINYS